MGVDWPLVGHAGELRRLREILSSVERAGALIAGRAGVGKTRLGLESLQAAERAGFAVARITATRAAAGLPFGALAPLLPAAHHGEAGAVDNRADLLRRTAAAFVERAAGRRLVVLVDDAHLLDPTSATLIHQLAATNAAFVLATVRQGEPAPDPVTALWKDGLVERVDLAGLRSEAVEELLAAVLGGPVDGAAVAQLAVRCEGNVLFLRELVQGALEDGTLSNDLGIWRLAGLPSLSDRLVELVEGRLEGLSPAERNLLETVAFGERVGAAELGAFGDAALAEALERKGLLLSETDGRRLEVRLAHPLYGEVVRARIPAIRARDIARSLAEIVEGAGARRREDTLRVATWRLDTGGARPELMTAAAQTARWRYDFALAERLARAAVDAGAGYAAAVLAAQLAGLQGRAAQAEAELAALAAQAADDHQRGLVAVTRLDNYVYYTSQLDEGVRIAEEAEATIVDPHWRDEIAARRCGLLLGTQGPRATAEAVEPLMARAGDSALVWACYQGSYSMARLGRLQAALDASVLGHATHLALTKPLDWYPCLHIFFRCEALTYWGRFAEAEALAASQYQQGLTDRSAETQAWFAWELAKTVGERGHVKAALRHAREASALFSELGRPTFVQFTLEHVALALALAGRAGEAAEAIEAIDALGLPQTAYVAVDLAQARAWTAVAAGDMTTARQILTEAADLGERIGDLIGAASALHALARLDRARDVNSRMKDLAAQIEGDLIAARAAHIDALTRNDPPQLAQVAETFADLGADLLAAEASVDATVAWRRHGDRRRAARAEQRAGILADRCEGASTPALQPIQARVRLTPAEREAAILAAAGRSNREIAETLNRSLRTVENQLHAVYEKLGVSGRSELATVLEETGS